MKLSSSLFPFLLLIMLGVAIGDQHPQSPGDNHSHEFHSMQAKLAYLKQNGAKAHPDSKPTELTEAEVNAYFNEGGVKLPKGVSHVRLSSQPGVIDAHAQIDFEAITNGRGSNNPVYSLFSGIHDIHAVAPASGANGTGSIRVQTVELDDATVPQFLLQLFVEHYLTPKYPNVGMTSTFKLPLHIDNAVVDSGRVRLVQK
jgi:hypothetical protein